MSIAEWIGRDDAWAEGVIRRASERMERRKRVTAAVEMVCGFIAVVLLLILTGFAPV